jgi:hypothetical protein
MTATGLSPLPHIKTAGDAQKLQDQNPSTIVAFHSADERNPQKGIGFLRKGEQFDGAFTGVWIFKHQMLHATGMLGKPLNYFVERCGAHSAEHDLNTLSDWTDTKHGWVLVSFNKPCHQALVELINLNRNEPAILILTEVVLDYQRHRVSKSSLPMPLTNKIEGFCVRSQTLTKGFDPPRTFQGLPACDKEVLGFSPDLGVPGCGVKVVAAQIELANPLFYFHDDGWANADGKLAAAIWSKHGAQLMRVDFPREFKDMCGWKNANHKAKKDLEETIKAWKKSEPKSCVARWNRCEHYGTSAPRLTCKGRHVSTNFGFLDVSSLSFLSGTSGQGLRLSINQPKATSGCDFDLNGDCTTIELRDSVSVKYWFKPPSDMDCPL